jgi:hypothetical protein
MAQTVVGAITALFAANAETFAAYNGGSGLWVEEIPEKEPLPLIVLWHDGEVPEWMYDSEWIERARVRFSCFATSIADAETAAAAVKSVFDLKPGQAVTLFNPVDNGKITACRRKDYKIKPTPFRSENGDAVWEVEMPYELDSSRIS